MTMPFEPVRLGLRQSVPSSQAVQHEGQEKDHGFVVAAFLHRLGLRELLQELSQGSHHLF